MKLDDNSRFALKINSPKYSKQILSLYDSTNLVQFCTALAQSKSDKQ
ncbi:hypothetical protein PPIS_b1191 [Pseudoalteromonas piscicida]|uniref:Uncharacterized protein n=1 Tax=Pseudoalteromonas piscicida TaxID=43662 RepID=A0ABM6NMG1_PSEO7|nr:hypothetical protein PPIS_b1191 [Pseudoalteromonas piscicida]